MQPYYETLSGKLHSFNFCTLGRYHCTAYQYWVIIVWKLLFHQKFLVNKVQKLWLWNRKRPLWFPYCENRTTGTVKQLSNYDFQTLITGISGEIDTSLLFCQLE